MELVSWIGAVAQEVRVLDFLFWSYLEVLTFRRVVDAGCPDDIYSNLGA